MKTAAHGILIFKTLPCTVAELELKNGIVGLLNYDSNKLNTGRFQQNYIRPQNTHSQCHSYSNLSKSSSSSGNSVSHCHCAQCRGRAGPHYRTRMHRNGTLCAKLRNTKSHDYNIWHYHRLCIIHIPLI